jgi:1-acyl-sn-glycerol-3-phosphate acyltransferase
MSNEEVLRAIREGIRVSDVTDPANLSIPFAGRRLAEGVERLVWTCAACGGTGTLRTAGDRVTCSSCDASWLVDAHCRLHGPDGTAAPFPDLHAWLAQERLQARAAVAEASDRTVLCIDSAVTMLVEDDHRAFVSDRTGTLSLTRSELLFEPDGAPEASVRLPVAALDSYVIQKKDLFEATFEGRSYRFDLAGRSPMKWLVHVRYLRGWEQIEGAGVI